MVDHGDYFPRHTTVAIRPVGGQFMARVASFVAPCFVANPNGDLWFAVVPVNDHLTRFYHVWWHPEKLIGQEPLRSQQLKFVGLDDATLDDYGIGPESWRSDRRPTWENGFRQDKAQQRAGHFTGIASFTQEDAICSVSGGPIRDRSIEMLSTADIAIHRLYRVLLNCVKQVRAGQAPIGVQADVKSIVGVSAPIADANQWRSLVPGHRLLKPAAAPATAAEGQSA